MHGNTTSKWKVMIEMKPMDDSKQIKAIPFVYILKEGGFKEGSRFHYS